MGAITVEDIRRLVSRNAFDAGLAYRRAGRVREIRTTADGGLIEARVHGSARAPCRQSIRNPRSGERAGGLVGACTCPVGFNCKHVAAVLFAMQEHTKSAAFDPGRLRPRPTPEIVTAAEPALPPEVGAWLASLERAAEEDSEGYPATVHKRLLYVLSTRSEGGGPHQLELGLASVALRKDGSLGAQTQRHSPQQLLNAAPGARYLRPSDRLLLRRLAHLGAGRGDLTGEDVADTLQRIIATGRARWRRVDGPVVTLGAARPAQLTWRLLEDGSQRACLDLGEGAERIGLMPSWFVEPTTGAMGPVATDLPPRLLRAVLAAPVLSPAAAAYVREELARRMPQRAIAPPRALGPPTPLAGLPRPHLHLLRGGTRTPAWSEVQEVPPLARLSFRYGELLVAAFETRPVLLHEGALYAVQRDRAAERAALERLDAIGFRLREGVAPGQGRRHDLVLPDSEDGVGWLDFMLDELPELRAASWEIDVAEDFPLRLVQPSGRIEAEIREKSGDGSGIDWFELDLGVMVDGSRVDLVPPLLELIARADFASILGAPATADEALHPLLLPLADGRLLALPMPTIRPTLAILFELSGAGGIDVDDERLRLPRTGLAELALLEAAGLEAGLVWLGAEALRALARQLRDRGGIPAVPVPADFRATLRPYQARGVDWLQFLRAAGLGGVLADDMGLGKTVQTLAHLAIEQAEGRLDKPALVVCPTSLVANWCAEAARFAPRLRVLALQGPDRKQHFADISGSDLVLTTYPLLFRDHAVLTAQDWRIVVLDEAQTIKNPAAATAVLARQLRAGQRLCLSGTPMENHLGELWSLFDFLMPGLLGDRQAFGRRFRGPVEKAGDTDRAKLLARRVAPFLLRRTKHEVAAELPPKTEITETIELASGQRAIYEGIRLAMHARVRAAIAERGLARSGIIILNALLKLRQACCDPRLLKLTAATAARAGSAKLDRLMELLPALLEEGRRVLLFSQFTSMLALIRAALEEAGLGHVLLTGNTLDRATPVARFQSGEVKLFLISLKAGGVGLNLTAADTVIHYDPWWNPAVEEQATDRAHRIGQRRAMFVHRLVTAGTIEEKMTQLKARKQALVGSILGAERGTALAMTEADLEMLFAPAAA